MWRECRHCWPGCRKQLKMWPRSFVFPEVIKMLLRCVPRKRRQLHKPAGALKKIIPVSVSQRKGDPLWVTQDEHPRPGTALDALAALRIPFKKNGCVTAGNASGVHDGAAALLLASKDAVERHALTPMVRVLGGSVAGVAPRIMGYTPVPATKKLMRRLGLSVNEFDVIELNEAFASQSLAVLRALKVEEDAAHVNPNGGAMALGHPLKQ